MNSVGSIPSSQTKLRAPSFDALEEKISVPALVSTNSLLQSEYLLADERQKDIVFSQLLPRPIPFWKRLVDIVASLILIVVLSPILVGIALLIRLTSKGPILFKQARLGEMGKDFVILKFRTLHPQESASEDHKNFVASLMDSEEAAAKPDLSKRFIPCGEWLRKTSLDELPQLINILRGEMSLIGPRPEILEWHQYQPWQLRRFEARPGVTGLWQVSGKNKLTFNQMISKDIEYIARRSVRFDLWILFKTFWMVCRRDNS